MIGRYYECDCGRKRWEHSDDGHGTCRASGCPGFSRASVRPPTAGEARPRVRPIRHPRERGHAA